MLAFLYLNALLYFFRDLRLLGSHINLNGLLDLFRQFFFDNNTFRAFMLDRHGFLNTSLYTDWLTHDGLWFFLFFLWLIDILKIWGTLFVLRFRFFKNPPFGSFTRSDAAFEFFLVLFDVLFGFSTLADRSRFWPSFLLLRGLLLMLFTSRLLLFCQVRRLYGWYT